jgi:hypothetical protein
MSEPTSPTDVIGWGAVVMPAKMWHHSIPITREDQGRADDVDKVITYGMANYRGPGSQTVQRMGALTSFLAQLAAEKPDNPMTRAAAALLSKEFGHRYWWVEAHEEGGGMHTSVFKLEGNTPEEAEAAFQEVPQVRTMMMMKAVMGLMTNPGGKDS